MEKHRNSKQAKIKGSKPSRVADDLWYEILDYVSEGVFWADENDRLMGANAYICHSLGYRRDELLGLNLSELISTSNSDGLDQYMDEHNRQGKRGYQCSLRKKDGSVIKVLLSVVKLASGVTLGNVRGDGEQGEIDPIPLRLAAIVNSSRDAIVAKDLNGMVTDWNESAQRIFGYTAEEMVGRSITRIIPDERLYEEDEILNRIKQGKRVEHFETVRKTKDGRLIDVSVMISPILTKNGKVIGASKIARDITKAKIREREHARMARLYDALSQINQTIVHVNNRKELFKKTCEILVERGGFQMAAIYLSGNESYELKPLAVYGDRCEIARSIELPKDQNLNKSEPSAIVYCTGRPIIINDLGSGEINASNLNEIYAAGYKSFAAFPIWDGDAVKGCLNVYSGYPGIFRAEETSLLNEAAGDLSFALDNCAREENRQRINDGLVYKNSILETLQDVSLDGILVVGINNEILSYNRSFMNLWKIPTELMERGDDGPVLLSVLDKIESSGDFISRVDYLYVHTAASGRDEIHLKDGRVIDRYSSPINNTDGKYLGRVWFFRDITENRIYENTLREKTELLQKVCAMAHVGGWVFDANTGQGTWTEEVARVHEVDLDFTPCISTSLEFYHGENRRILEQAVKAAIEDGISYDLELEMESTKGRTTWVRTICEPVLQNGRVLEISGTMQDITEHKINEQGIKRLNRVLSTLSHINALIIRAKCHEELYKEACRIAVDEGRLGMAMIAVIDGDQESVVPVASVGKGVSLMDKIRKILLSKNMNKTMISRAISELKPSISNNVLRDSKAVFKNDYIEAGVHSMAVLPLIVNDKAVGIFALYAQEIDYFNDEEVKLLTEMAHDVAFAIDHLDKKNRLEYLAIYDELTGLANQRLFIDRVTQDIRAAQNGGWELAIALIDIARFKSINDSLGRDSGDKLLKLVAEWLAKEYGEADLVARIHADQFAIVTSGLSTSVNWVNAFEKTIRAFTESPFQLREDAIYRLGIKMGVAIYPEHGSDAESLVRKAEVALKRAKSHGDPYLFYSPELDERVAENLTMENQLRQAITNEEFVLYYQPKLCVENGKVVGAEALIRWQKPGVGLIQPNEFIPILEETGLIHEVGRWALRKAVSDYLYWRSVGLKPVRISVNVSPLQLRKSDFITDINNKADMDPHAAEGLDLELTESAVMENIQANILTLTAIRDMGIHVTLDDFGTGFSSLSYLSRLPLDMLKIDRSFITRMTDSPESLALVSTIINLAHSLKLKVVAEGVETQEQMRLLRLIGCDEIQGFLISKAVPAEEFASNYLEHSP